MLLLIGLIILSLGLSALIFVMGKWWTTWYYYPIALLIAVGFFLVLFIFIIFVMGIIYSRYQGSDKDYKPNRFFQYFIGEISLVGRFIFGVKWIKEGFKKVPKCPCMFVSNHLSNFDPILLIAEYRHRNLVAINKKVISQYFLIGGIVKKAGYISIKQKDILDGNRCIDLAAEYIKNGTSVYVCPEGTRNKDFPDPKLLPFHPGTFNMAIKAQCPIVVFALQNTNAISKRWPLSTTQVYADVVGVLYPEDYKNLTPAEIAKKTRQLIADRFEQKEARFYHLRPNKKGEKKSLQ